MWPEHCVENTLGAEFHPDLMVKETDIIISKGMNPRVEQYSGFGSVSLPTELEKTLKELNIATVYVVGLAYDYCVGNTAKDAAKLGFKTFVVVDLTQHVGAETHSTMDCELSSCGVVCTKSADVKE